MEYSIGQFAALTKVSPRMLRYFEKFELLKPQKNNENNYRVYADRDVHIISKILFLQGAGFTLQEIKRIFNEDNDYLITLSKNKLAEVINSASTTEKSLKLLRQIIGDKTFIKNNYDVSLTKKSEEWMLVKKTSNSLGTLDSAMSVFYELIVKNNINVHGGVCNYHKYSEDNFDINHLAILTKEQYQLHGYECQLLESRNVISTFHYGGYSNICCAYDKLLTYAAQHNYILENWFLERYLVDNAFTNDENDYLTEISIKVL